MYGVNYDRNTHYLIITLVAFVNGVAKEQGRQSPSSGLGKDITEALTNSTDGEDDADEDVNEATRATEHVGEGLFKEAEDENIPAKEEQTVEGPVEEEGRKKKVGDFEAMNDIRWRGTSDVQEVEEIECRDNKRDGNRVASDDGQRPETQQLLGLALVSLQLLAQPTFWCLFAQRPMPRVFPCMTSGRRRRRGGGAGGAGTKEKAAQAAVFVHPSRLGGRLLRCRGRCIIG